MNVVAALQSVDPNNYKLQTARAVLEWMAVYLMLAYFHSYALQMKYYESRENVDLAFLVLADVHTNSESPLLN